MSYFYGEPWEACDGCPEFESGKCEGDNDARQHWCIRLDSGPPSGTYMGGYDEEDPSELEHSAGLNRGRP